MTETFHSTPTSAAGPRSEAAIALRWLFGFALLLGLFLRFVGFSGPPYDSHNFRQTQTLATIEEFHAHGIDLLRPKTNYAGYPGYFVLEFPAFQALAALVYDLIGPHLEAVRLLNIFFGSLCAWLLYLITARLFDRTTAILATLIYWLAPLNVVFHRSTLLDPMAVACSLGVFLSLAVLFNIGNCPAKSNPFLVAALLCLICLVALIKVLYLWPAILLFGHIMLVRRFRPDRALAGAFFAFVAGGVCFVLWSMHATRVNSASPFTSGLKISNHLGFAPLLDPQFYVNQIVRRPKWWLGALGALLYPLGLAACWAELKERRLSSPSLLIFAIPPSYLLLFAKINHPHEYYQLLITPFLAIMPALGIRWLASRFNSPRWPGETVGRVQNLSAAALIVAAPLTCLLWFKIPYLDQRLVRFEALCRGKLRPGSSALLYVARSSTANYSSGLEVPQFLYAARLWGYGKVVEDEKAARELYEKNAAAFPGLDYVLLYGTDRPDWLPDSQFKAAVLDPGQSFYLYQHKPAHQKPEPIVRREAD